MAEVQYLGKIGPSALRKPLPDGRILENRLRPPWYTRWGNRIRLHQNRDDLLFQTRLIAQPELVENLIANELASRVLAEGYGYMVGSNLPDRYQSASRRINRPRKFISCRAGYFNKSQRFDNVHPAEHDYHSSIDRSFANTAGASYLKRSDRDQPLWVIEPGEEGRVNVTLKINYASRSVRDVDPDSGRSKLVDPNFKGGMAETYTDELMLQFNVPNDLFKDLRQHMDDPNDRDFPRRFISALYPGLTARDYKDYLEGGVDQRLLLISPLEPSRVEVVDGNETEKTITVKSMTYPTAEAPKGKIEYKVAGGDKRKARITRPEGLPRDTILHATLRKAFYRRRLTADVIQGGDTIDDAQKTSRVILRRGRKMFEVEVLSLGDRDEAVALAVAAFEAKRGRWFNKKAKRRLKFEKSFTEILRGVKMPS